MSGSGISGKTALVTGGSRGIGRAIAVRLAREGAFVVVAASSSADDTLLEIQSNGGRAKSVAADISSSNGVSQLVTRFRDASGAKAPDILINNAGIYISKTVSSTTESDYDSLFAINARAPFFITQHFIADFPENGRIINVSSRLSQTGTLGQTAYAMTKSAINAFTKGLATELGPRGITVNAIGPGPVETDMMRSSYDAPAIRAEFASSAALKRTALPNDVAGVAVFLASDDARWVTGAYFDVAGGAGL